MFAMVVILGVRGRSFRGCELCGAQLDFQVFAASENVMISFIKRFTRSNFSADPERRAFPLLICLSCAFGFANFILFVIHCLASVRSLLLHCLVLRARVVAISNVFLMIACAVGSELGLFPTSAALRRIGLCVLQCPARNPCCSVCGVCWFFSCFALRIALAQCDFDGFCASGVLF